MAAPTFVDSGANGVNGASGTSCVLNFAGSAALDIIGEASNDYAIVALYKESNAAVSTPAGWTLLGQTDQSTGGFKYRAAVYGKRLTGSETTVTWSWTGSTWCYLEAAVYRNAVTTEDPVVTYVAEAETAQNTAPNHAAITVKRANSALVWIVFNFSDISNTTAPTGYTYRLPDATSLERNILFYDDLTTTAGSSGTVTATLSGDIEYPLTVLLELATEAGTSPTTLTPSPATIPLIAVTPTVTVAGGGATTLTPSPAVVQLAVPAASVDRAKVIRTPAAVPRAFLMDTGTEAVAVTWSHATTQPLTMAFWCRLDEGSSGHGNVATIANVSFNSEVGFWIPDFRPQIYQGSVMITSVQTDVLSSSVSYGSWHHVVLSRDDPSGIFRGYLDGIPFPTEAGITPSPNGIIADVVYLVVGAGGVSHFFHGAISQFRVWLARLSADEIVAEMYSPTAVRSSNLYGDWKFDGALTDAGGSARHMAGAAIPTSGAVTYSTGTLTAEATPPFVQLVAVGQTITVGALPPTVLTPSPAVVSLSAVGGTVSHAKALAPTPAAVPLTTVTATVTHAKTLGPTPAATAIAAPTQTLVLGGVVILAPTPATVPISAPSVAVAHAKTLELTPAAIALTAPAATLSLGGVVTLAPTPASVAITPVGATVTLAKTLTLEAVVVPILAPTATLALGGVISLNLSPAVVSLVAVPVTPGGALALTPQPAAVQLAAAGFALERVYTLSPTPRTVPILAIGSTVTLAKAIAVSPVAIILTAFPVTVSGVVILGPGTVHAGSSLNGHTRIGGQRIGSLVGGAELVGTAHGGPAQRQ